MAKARARKWREAKVKVRPIGVKPSLPLWDSWRATRKVEKGKERRAKERRAKEFQF